MESHSTNHDQLIASFFSGNSNLSEIELLEQWKNLSKENKKIFDDSVIVWNSCRKPLTKAEIAMDKLAVEERIITKISLQQKRDRFAIRLLRIVAVLLGPIMLALGWYFGSSTTNYSKDLTWNTVTAPKKHIAVCTLSDGTEVWLNAGSTISYPAYPSSGERRVRLSGEGYFKVTKDHKNPFFVTTLHATVKVLGTSFDMKAYPGEERLVTTLEEGSIELFTQKT
ncbi:MAG: FecR family protein, partial [Bacteroidota bacterium]